MMIEYKDNGKIDTAKTAQNAIEAVTTHGFVEGHTRVLSAIKTELLNQNPEWTVTQCRLLESALFSHYIHADIELPSIKQCDEMFATVFESEGRAIVDEAWAKANQAVAEHMEETGLPESEARRDLVDGMLAGMELFTTNIDKITGEIHLSQQIEEAIGPVDWEDMPED